jgi:hypothetical protein
VTAGIACTVCAFAAERHRWPMEGTHCRDCHRSWTSLVQSHCTVCHEHFATNGVADLHWRGAGHVDAATVPALEAHDEANGPVWRSTGGRVRPPMGASALRVADRAHETGSGGDSARNESDRRRSALARAEELVDGWGGAG